MENEETGTSDKKKEEFNRKTGEMGKKILEYIDKGVVLSQKGLKSAGKAISDFGDKSVQRIELAQLKKKLEKEYNSLGKFVCDKFSEFPDSELSSSDVKTFIEKIDALSADIKKHEDAVSAVSESASVSEESDEDVAADAEAEEFDVPEEEDSEEINEQDLQS